MPTGGEQNNEEEVTTEDSVAVEEQTANDVQVASSSQNNKPQEITKEVHRATKKNIFVARNETVKEKDENIKQYKGRSMFTFDLTKIFLLTFFGVINLTLAIYFYSH